ncbi:MAG: DUF3015 domain-containing protein [Saccharospirillum sp.]|nr:DUF3015 domain-containing protein [Saccharospirillum sp.]
MKLFKMALAAVAMVSMIGSAAAQRDFAAIYKECGLGALLFPNDPIIAVVTNVTWDLGTTAVISELSSPETCNGNPALMASLVLDAYPQLEQELAIGEGEYLASMVNLMGCEGVEGQAVSALRVQFADSVAGGTYYDADGFEKAEVLYNAAMSTSNQLCTI